MSRLIEGSLILKPASPFGLLFYVVLVMYIMKICCHTDRKRETHSFQIDVCIETVLKLDKSFLNNSCILESETLLIKVMLNSTSVSRILKITHGDLSYAKVI